MTESEHRRAFDSLGAYALGALADSEREAVAAHIETCPVCAEDASAMQRAATRLIDVVPMLAPAADLRNRIMAVVEPEAALLRAASTSPREVRVTAPRRRGAWADAFSLRWASTAAALLILGGLLGATVLGGDSSSSDGAGKTRTLEASVGRGHAWVEVTNGQARLVVNGLRPPSEGRVYEMWVQHGSEDPRPASNHLADTLFVVRSGRIDIPARLGAGDRVMVTAEPRSGSHTPTTIPVVITANA